MQNNNKMSGLGRQVLDKIQELILQIDRPKSPKHRKTKKVAVAPQNQQRINRVQQQQYYPGERLYNRYREVLKKEHERQTQKVHAQIQTMRQFKVENKKSIFLNNQQKRKPIYQRVNQIIDERERAYRQKILEKIKIQQEKKRQEQYQAQQIFKNDKKWTKKQAQEFLKKLEQKQIERSNKITLQKLQHLKRMATQHTLKPMINEQSRKIWNKKQVNRSLSTNYLQRFQQYQWDMKRKKQQRNQHVRLTETPFSPNISKNSRIIANSMQRSPLMKELDHSPSCKCFIKQNRHHQTSTSTQMQTSRATKSHSRQKIRQNTTRA